MKFYQHKDFLTFEDVAEYLTDKGMLGFDISESSDRYKLNNFLKDLVLEEKLNIVFRYYGRTDFFNGEFTQDYENPAVEKINFLGGEKNLILLFDSMMFKNWLDGQDFLSHSFFDERIHTRYYQIPVYELFGCNYSYLENKNPLFIILLDDNSGRYGVEPLFPKSQLDTIFLRQQKESLQEQINTIDSQLNDKELTANSQKAVTKLLYALLKEHEYELGAKKGTTNTILESLTAKHGVSISRETISRWLDMVNALDK